MTNGPLREFGLRWVYCNLAPKVKDILVHPVNGSILVLKYFICSKEEKKNLMSFVFFF